MPRPRLWAVVAVALAAGCSSSSPGAKAPATVTSTTTPATTGVPTGGTATTAAGTSTTTTTGPGTAACPSSALAASLANTQGTAGTSFSHLLFRNTSTRTCTLAGFPGVSFVDGGGHQVGAAVPRSTGSGVVITVAPGGSAGAVFALHTAYVGSVPGCQPTEVTGLRIYPPGQTAALFVPHQFTVCSNPATDGSASIGAITTLADLPT